MNIKNTSIYWYNKKSEKTAKTTLEKLLLSLEKSKMYPFTSGLKFFFSDKEAKTYKKKYEKWLNNLNK